MTQGTRENLEPLPRMLFTIPEVAVILAVNENTVHELRKAGLLKALKLGRYKVRRTTLEEFLALYDGQDISEILKIKWGEKMRIVEQTTIRLPAELKKKLQQEAERKGQTVNQFILIAINEYIINHQK